MVILFLCICLAVKTLLLLVYLVHSAWMEARPKMNRPLNQKRGKFVIRPLGCLFKVPCTRMNPPLCWLDGLCFVQDFLLSFWPEVAVCT